MDLVPDAGREIRDRAETDVYDSMVNLLASANAGSFAVSRAGGDALLAVIKEFKGWMAAQSNQSTQVISQRPPLGQLEGGKAMAPAMMQVALDHEGFVTRFCELRETLNKAEEAINKAMANYRENDARSAGLFPSAPGDVG
jgi:hypothetical protein